MSILTITLSTPDEVSRRAEAAFAGQLQGARLSFASPDLLWKVLSSERWDILKAMAGKGAMPIRDLAHALGRDIGAIQRDVHALIQAGVIDQMEEQRIVFSYDAIRVDFLLRAA